MDKCVFCPIAAGEVDADLVALRTEHVFVIPALRQHPSNHGHALVLPVKHTRNLADAPPSLRNEIFAVTAHLTSVVLTLYAAEGSIVFQNNTTPDDPFFHLHVHVAPRFPDDHFVMTRAAVAEVPRAERLQQAASIRRAFAPGRSPCNQRATSVPERAGNCSRQGSPTDNPNGPLTGDRQVDPPA